MIEFKNLYKSFGAKKVLQGLNLKINTGEVFFILGGSGTGKSVALKTFIGLLKSDSGEILYNTNNTCEYSELQYRKLRTEVSMVFQLPALLDSRTLAENLILPIRFLDPKERAKRINNALIASQLDKFLDNLGLIYPTSLSYGEQKRMALARSLVMEPKVLLYDEPTTGMDAETAREIHKLIRNVSEKFNTTSVVVSHDIQNAIKTADSLAVMEEGRCVFYGTPDDIKKSKIPLIKSFMSSAHIAGASE